MANGERLNEIGFPFHFYVIPYCGPRTQHLKKMKCITATAYISLSLLVRQHLRNQSFSVFFCNKMQHGAWNEAIHGQMSCILRCLFLVHFLSRFKLINFAEKTVSSERRATHFLEPIQQRNDHVVLRL